MNRVRGLPACALSVITSAMFSAALAAQAGDPAVIQQQLNSQFQVTRITADRSDIVTPGSVVELHRNGLIMYAVFSPMPPSNTYKNGKIGQGWGGFGKDLMIGMAAPGGATANDYPHRQFMAGEKCWVTGVQAQKDGISLQLYSDPYDGIRFYANLKIPFPDKKTAPPPEAALQLVAEVLTVVGADNQGGQGGPPPPPPAPLPAPASSQFGDIAPPPPPPSATPTIALGQTRLQVVAAFGPPLRKAALGAQEVYVYKDMKVTFTNGKVSDVE